MPPNRAPRRLVVLALLGSGAACGGTEAAGAQRAGTAAAPAAEAPGCPTAEAVSRSLDLQVREFPAGTMEQGGTMICAYEATDRALGAFVSLVIGPASESAKAFEEVRTAAKTFLGQAAQADAIDVGERGLAYGAASKSEAVAVKGGRLYRADVTSTAQAKLGDRKAGLVRLLKRVVG